MKYLALFRIPAPIKITGRSSSTTNAFVNSIIPVVPQVRLADIRKSLEILGMTPDRLQCVYCGGFVSEWDYLRPLVKIKIGMLCELQN